MALSIVGRLLFDGKRWKTGLDQAKDQARTFGKSLPGVIGIGNLAKNFAAAFTLTAAVGATKRVIENADRLQKAAQSVGLSSNEFSKLAFAADLSGLSVEQLTTGVSQFSRVLSEAAAGRGGQGIFEALDRLGISAEKFTQLGVVDQFKELSAAMSGRTINTQTLADLQALFGESGRRFIPLLQSDLADAIQQGTDLGAFASDDAIDNLVAAKDEMTKLNTAAKATSSEILRSFGLAERLKILTEAYKTIRLGDQGSINAGQLAATSVAALSAAAPFPLGESRTAAKSLELLGMIQKEIRANNDLMRRAFE